MDINLAKQRILNLDKNNQLENIKINDIPIWWFFKSILILNTLPTPFLNFSEISNEKDRGKLRHLKTKIISKIAKKYILRNEKNKIKVRKRQLTQNDKEKTLLLTYSNHVKDNGILRLSPIINKLKEDKKTEPFILVNDLISKKIDKSLLNYEHTIYEYITKDLLKKAKKLAREINNKWEKIEKNNFHNFIKEELNFLLSKEILEIIIMYYLACEEIIKKENIKAVVITADTGFMDKALMASVKEKEIPIINVHHGSPGTVPIETFSKIKVCIKGKAFKRNLEKTNFKGEIVITGSVDHDKILKYKKEIKKEKKVITIITSPLVEDNFMKKSTYQKYIKKFLKDINKIDNVEIIISLHPRENDIKKYREITKDYKNIRIIKKLDIEYLYKILNYTDVSLSFGSGTTIEATIFNKPSVYINLFGKDIPYIRLYEGSDTVAELDKEEDISIPIKNILENKELQEKLAKARKKFVEEYCYKVDGKATERIVNEIYKSLENGKRDFR